MLTLDRLHDGDIHTLADFAELLCLLTPDRVISVEDLQDHLVDVAGRARHTLPLNDAFAHIEWRVQAFGAAYPFRIATNSQSFSAEQTLNEAQTAYVFLLLSASLPYFAAQERKQLTDAFERAAHCALRRIWPAHGTVRTFGKNNTDYTGSKAERMTALGLDMGCRPTVQAGSFRARDSGDGGIDLAAWVDLDPAEKENIPCALAQCACSRDDWSTKQPEISHGKLSGLLNPRAPWIEFVFIPISFRNNNGRWAVEADVHQTIVVDRLRMLRFLQFPLDWTEIQQPAILQQFLAERLDLV